MYNHQLKVFICVAECGSFSRASQLLYMSPTAVMKQINNLEKHLGISLFIRTKTGSYLTEAGKSIYKNAKKIIQFSDDAILEAVEISKRGVL